MNGYRTIAHESEIEIDIKKSRYIGYAFLVSSAEEANEKLSALRKRQWDASHHCSAYVLGADKQLQKYSDDGEPQGTAGMPILQVLHHKDVTNTMVVVVRYFGGVLLGAGGLVRAYSEAAAKALDAAGLCQYVPVVRWGFAVDYAHWARLDRFLQSSDIQLEQTDYGAEVLCQGLSREEAWESFRQALYNHCDGRVEVQFAEHAIAPWPID